MSASPDVMVVGAGLVGGATALGLARRGWQVLLLEREQPGLNTGRFAMDVRNVAVSPGSQHLLAELNVWSKLTPAAYRAMHVWEEQGTEAMDFSAAEIDRSELGWIVENSPAVCALWDALEKEPNIELVVDAGIEQIEADAESIRLRTGCGQYRAKLLIGVDGARSTVRALLGTRVETHPTGHEAIATLVRTQRGHNGVALQRFLLDGPLALLPSREANISSVVWSQSPASAQRRMALSDEDFCDELGSAIEHHLGAIEAVAERFAFPLQQQLVEDFNPRSRVLLIGDAARVLHPMAGLGANVGFEDVRDLLARFDAIPATADPGAAGVWRSFARQRRARARMMLSLMSGFKQAYAKDDPLLGWLRNAGVGWLNRALPLKKQLIREALGLGPLASRW